MTTLDVPANWRLLTMWTANQNHPDECRGITPLPSDARTVLIETGFDLIELRDWLVANTRGAFKLYARFDFTTYAYRIDKDLTGLNVAFADADDAFFFKMRWF